MHTHSISMQEAFGKEPHSFVNKDIEPFSPLKLPASELCYAFKYLLLVVFLHAIMFLAL